MKSPDEFHLAVGFDYDGRPIRIRDRSIAQHTCIVMISHFLYLNISQIKIPSDDQTLLLGGILPDLSDI